VPEERVALVIGNAAHKLAPLRNPLNDACAMQASLRELGFSVIAVENGNRKAMQHALRQFPRQARRDHRRAGWRSWQLGRTERSTSPAKASPVASTRPASRSAST